MTPPGRRVALVSGGSRGIGRATCLALAADGYDIALCYRRDRDAAGSIVEELTARGAHARAYEGDVADSDWIAVFVESVRSDFGRIDALVHAAGVASRGLSVADTDAAEVIRLMTVHALAGHQLARSAIPAMRAQGGASIVFISSTITTSARPGAAPYTMAKTALEALGTAIAIEERPHGIRVNVVAPGLVATDMGDRLVNATQGHRHASDLDAQAPFGRVCRPEDVAGCVAFLCSERAGYVTGQRIAVDGGEAWGWWGDNA